MPLLIKHPFLPPSLHLTDMPERGPGSVDFSSHLDDKSSAASNWRNVIIPFSSAVVVPKNSYLLIWCTAYLDGPTPGYRFHVCVDGIPVVERKIRALNLNFQKQG